MLIIKNSNLSPIPQLQFIQNGTEIISYRSLTEKQFCGNLLIAVSVGNQPDDIQLPFADVSGSIIKSVGRLQEFRDFGYDLCAEYGLAGVNRLKSWKSQFPSPWEKKIFIWRPKENTELKKMYSRTSQKKKETPDSA